MTIDELAKQCHVPVGMLLAVLHRYLVRPRSLRAHETPSGTQWSFEPEDGLLIATAAALMGSGLHGRAVERFANYLIASCWRPARSSRRRSISLVPSFHEFVTSETFDRLLLQFGDGEMIRLLADDNIGGWFHAESRAFMGREYRPLVVVEIDLGRLCHALGLPLHAG